MQKKISNFSQYFHKMIESQESEIFCEIYRINMLGGPIEYSIVYRRNAHDKSYVCFFQKIQKNEINTINL